MSVTVYTVNLESGFARLLTVPGSGGLLMFDGTRFGNAWHPLPVHVPHPDRKKWDISTIYGPAALVLTPHAASLLGRYFESGNFELLPLVHIGIEYTVVNVLEIVDCVDLAASQVRQVATESVIDRYAFHVTKLRSTLFKTPDAVQADLFAWESSDGSPSFKRLVEQHDLKGIRFKKIWETAGPGDV